MANGITWKPVKPNPKLTWGPTVYSKEFTSVSLTTVIHNMLEWVSKNNIEMVDTFVHQGVKRVTLEIYYKKGGDN